MVSEPDRKGRRVRRKSRWSHILSEVTLPDIGGLQSRNIIENHALLSVPAPNERTASGVTLKESRVPMATRQQRQIVETPTEARQAEPGPSVLALLVVSTGLAVLILGVIWFAFFRT
jgi:hypothetical protein